jgi:hypothetical protein
VRSSMEHPKISTHDKCCASRDGVSPSKADGPNAGFRGPTITIAPSPTESVLSLLAVINTAQSKLTLLTGQNYAEH